MFALRITYLMGRVYSASFDQGDLKLDTEWPPHPSRLFSALVSAWAEGGAEDELRIGLEWLEKQAPPAILASESSSRKNVQAYVPVNDHRSLPDGRPRKGRTFPSATLDVPEVYFVWDDDAEADTRNALDTIANRTSSLGHSASVIAAEVIDNLPLNGLKRWQPTSQGETRLRVPYEGRLTELGRSYKLFQNTGNKVHRPSAGKSVLYSTRQPSVPKVARGIFDTMAVLQRVSGPRASLRATIALSSALRGAIMCHAPQPVPEFLSGHAAGSTPENPVRGERPHLAIVPLAYAGSPHATGDVMGLGILLPDTLTVDERQLCWSVLSKVKELSMAFGVWKVALADSEARVNLLPQTWTRKSCIWSTVTPLVLDRYPKDPYGDEAHHIVREAFTRVGLPEPVELDLHYNPWHAGVPKASLFPPAPSREGKPRRFHCHVRARFEHEIEGPVIAGAGRFYGYGLFRRIEEAA